MTEGMAWWQVILYWLAFGGFVAFIGWFFIGSIGGSFHTLYHNPKETTGIEWLTIIILLVIFILGSLSGR